MGTKLLHYNQPALQGEITVPGDKSISHRSVMFGSIAKGQTTVSGFLLGEDCLSTIDCFKKLGVKISVDGTNVAIESPGIDGWTEPSEVLYTGNSGTTTRLMLGILSGTKLHTVMTGDASIGKRPMRRVADPLRLMGAKIAGRENGQFTPLAIQGGELKAIDYTMPVASAQVKSAILLAGLRAKGTTVVRENEVSRDHTERMLRQFGAKISVEDNVVSFEGGQQLTGTHVNVPGDISSAAFFLVAGAITKGSRLVLNNVGVNETRDGIIEVLRNMGAKMTVQIDDEQAVEPTATITIESSKLKATTISGAIIPRLIDEIPIIALLATQAHGKTIIKDAEELKVKETNRIDAVVNELKKLGANIEATNDGMIIEGPTLLKGASLNTYGDHRIGMMGAVAALVADGQIELGEEDEALNLLMGISNDSPEYPQALLVLADYYQMQGLFEVAELRITEALQILPNEPLLQFAKAELLFETGRFAEAARIYEELYTIDKKFAGVSLAERLAEVYRAGAGYETALDYYMEALEEEVTPDLLFGSGYAAFQTEKYELATKQLEDLKELDPDYFSAYLLLAESYAMQEENERALKVIKEGLARDEYDKSLFLFAGKMALKNSMPIEAINYLQEAIALDPEYMEAILVLMSVYSTQEEYEAIIDLYEQLQQNDFEWVALYPFVANAYNEEEQFEKAYEIYKLAYNEFNEDVQFLEKYCLFLVEDGKREEAKEIAQRLVQLQPTEQQWLDLLERFE